MPDTSPAPAADKRILAIQEVCARFCHAHMDAHHSVCATVHAELARSHASIGPDSERHEGWCQTRRACDCGKHVERPTVMKDDRTYCSCGRPWPCPLADSIGPDSERIRELEADNERLRHELQRAIDQLDLYIERLA